MIHVLSEPPEIGNWFSSYVYESFVLDTHDDAKNFISQEIGIEKEGSFVMGESQKEQEHIATFRESRSCHGVDVGNEKPNGFGKSNGCFEVDEHHGNDKKSLNEVKVIDISLVFSVIFISCTQELKAYNIFFTK